MRLAPGIYAEQATLPPEQVARHHLFTIVSSIWPGGVLCGITAFAGGVPHKGLLHVAHPDPARTSPLKVPGVTVVPVVGPGPLPGDTQMPSGLFLSGPARVLVENVDTQGRRPFHRAGTRVVEDRIDELARSGGAGRIRTVLDQLDVIAGSFDRFQVEAVRSRLAAVLGSFSAGVAVSSDRLSARLSGAPYDQHRLEMIEQLCAFLERRAPSPIHAYPPMARWEWLAFFEAYFSNFIEGTEFGVEEARRIAVEGVIPAARPADAHDVSATYRLAVDPDDRVLLPHSGEQLVDILEQRHRILMAARPEKNPGVMKNIPNFAGGYQFVEPTLVRGTLMRGFDILNRLEDPFARAVAMMLLVTECHPFDDGNGRVARLTSNAELSAAGQVRVLIPIVYRDNYLAALAGVSGGVGLGQSLFAVLAYAQKWAAAVDWSSYNGAHKVLEACHAYATPQMAEANNLHLEMPSGLPGDAG